MANRHMERCSTLLIIREIKIKATSGITPIKTANHQKTTNNKCWRESKLVQLLWKTVWRSSKS